ncbi:MAG: hypothetical protein KF796_20835 [Ramlibacter sp.]|nr:hypothetical protein [Ramlibacter sp.]
MSEAERDPLEFVSPAERPMTVEGVQLLITPLLVKELPRVIRAVDPLLSTLLIEGDTLDAQRLVSLMGSHGEAIIEAVAICVRRPPEWVGNLLPDRLVALALASLEVNADFFSRALTAAKAQAPKLAPTVAARIMAGSWPGATPSTG